MNILLIGGGGREHAIAYKLSESPLLKQLYIVPGNPGTSMCGTNVDFDVSDFLVTVKFIVENKIDMVVVGPEQPLVDGITDFLHTHESTKHVKVLGPTKEAAQLEGSKDFAKRFMFRHGIPTARYKTFSQENVDEGMTFLESLKPPYVLKADGLAAGKGVVILGDLSQAKAELRSMIEQQKFGDASKQVVVEEFLKGIELSVFVITDGESYKILPEAKDYKRIGEKDTGLNTGGMGSVSPVPFADKTFMRKVETRIIRPTIEGLKKDDIPYVGFVFFGLINVEGDPFVIEYNVRMGDPETESVFPRIESDVVALFSAATTQQLEKQELNISDSHAACVMMVAEGYPSDYRKGDVIEGCDAVKDSLVFHAGTKRNADGNLVTSGGRVMAITSLANNLESALATTYANVDRVQWKGKYYRKDIAKDLLA